jgi:hypothetical protein
MMGKGSEHSASVPLKDIERTIFVVSYGRSGSTLTQSYLNTLPNTLVRGENGNLLYHFCKTIHTVASDDMYVWRREDAKLQAESRRAYLRNFLGTTFDPWFGAENVSPDALEASLAQLFIDQIIKPSRGTRTIGVKEIRWADDPRFFPHFLRILCRMFPNVHFIFQTRNWEEVTKSSWWSKMPAEKVKSYVDCVDSLFKDAADEHKNSLLLDYSELKNSLDGFRRISEFLGEEFDEEAALSVSNHRLSH